MFDFKSIAHFHASLRSGQATCVDTVKHYLAAIEANQHLNCFLEVYGEEALERAAYLDRSSMQGKLHGVVIGLKDNICYKDHRVSASSKILKDFISLYSATAVERLLQEGAIIIGRQNCDEFGMGSTNENSAYGPVLNPQDHQLVPGGSSGGSAAAVSAGLCMAALGSDTGGSVRLPADFCGVVGFKPAYGAVSRHGLIAYASSFDQIGVLATNVEDAELIYQVIEGPDEYDSTAVIHSKAVAEEEKSYRIAYFPDWIQHASVDPEITHALHRQIDLLKEQGHDVQPVSFDLTDYIVPTYYILTTAEASSNLARYDGVRYGPAESAHAKNLQEFYIANRNSGFGSEVKRRIMLGSFVLSAGYYDAYFAKAQQVRRLLLEQTKRIFHQYDFILAPNAPTIAFRPDTNAHEPIKMYMGDIFTVYANLTGVPAISLPVFKHSSKITFGLQFMSSPQNVVNLLRFTHQLMQNNKGE